MIEKDYGLDLEYLATYNYKNINGEIVFKKTVLFMFGHPVYREGWFKSSDNKWKMDKDAFLPIPPIPSKDNDSKDEKKFNIPRNVSGIVGKTNELKVMLYNIDKVKGVINQNKKVLFVENETDVEILKAMGYFSVCLSKSNFKEKELVPLIKELKNGEIYIIKQYVQDLVKYNRKKQSMLLLKNLINVCKTVKLVDLKKENQNYNNIFDIFYDLSTETEMKDMLKRLVNNSEYLK